MLYHYFHEKHFHGPSGPRGKTPNGPDRKYKYLADKYIFNSKIIELAFEFQVFLSDE